MKWSFDQYFAALIRLTGWGLGVFVIVTDRLDPAEDVALILGFIGYEFVNRIKDRKLPELLEKKGNGKNVSQG